MTLINKKVFAFYSLLDILNLSKFQAIEQSVISKSSIEYNDPEVKLDKNFINEYSFFIVVLFILPI